jgi:hypothetical protein
MGILFKHCGASLDKATSVEISRQIEHGKFVHTQEKPYYFVTFRCQHDDSFVEDENQLSEWVTYFFYPKEKTVNYPAV